MRAQALTTLTSRALSYFDLPDEERVEIGFRKPGANGNPSGSRLHAAFEWRVVNSTFVEQFTGISATRRKDGGVRLKALNHAAAEAKQAKLLLFAPQALLGKTRAKPAVAPTTPGAIIEELPTKQTGILKACKLAGPDGPYGYLRIYTFDVKRVEVFLKEIRQLLEALPQRGLIVDIRDNPGGVVVAAESLLQYFTPNRIEPARFSVLATDFSRQFCSWGDNVEEFKEWWPSLKAAIRNGEPYSAAISVTKPELCNDGCQVYSGPVVLVADSATYSSGDLFAAGFVDNEIGTFVCVGDSTGAGGASVENYLDLRTVSFDSSFELPKLPDGAGLLMSVMRATRAGRSLGTQIEDVGVAGNKTYVHSRDDLLHDNRDLLAKCVGLLHQERATRLDCGYRTADRTLEVRTSGLKQLDIKVDD